MKKQVYFLLTLLLLPHAIKSSVSLHFVTDKDFSEGIVQSVDWHTVENYTFLAYVGKNDADRDVRVAKFKNMFNLDVRAEINLFDNIGGKATAVAWTNNGPRYLAVGGENNEKGKEIKIYNYKVYQGGNLERRAYENMSRVNSLDWLRFNNMSYLAVGGFDDYRGQELRIYAYTNDTLIPVSGASFFHGEVNAVKWLTDASHVYLAVGGYETGSSVDTNTRIYQFDPNTNTLTLLDTQAYNFDTITSVAWVVNATNIYLATTGSDKINNAQIRLYDFNGISLSFITQQSFDYGVIHSSDWLISNGIMYLAVCGDDGVRENEIRLYLFDGSSLNMITSINLGLEIPLAIKWQFVNGIPFLAVGTDGSRALKLYSLAIN